MYLFLNFILLYNYLNELYRFRQTHKPHYSFSFFDESRARQCMEKLNRHKISGIEQI